MKKKFVSVVLASLMVASMAAGCGGEKQTEAPAADTKTEAEAPAADAAPVAADTDTDTDAEAEVEDVAADDSESGDFTLLDVSVDMVEAGVYAISEDQTELVFTMFTEPSGTPMASLFIFEADGSGDVICGTYTADTETDEDGIDWTVLTVSDVYTGGEFQIGFGESEDEVYIFDGNYSVPLKFSNFFCAKQRK